MNTRTKTMAAMLLAGVMAIAACSGLPGVGDANAPVGAVNAAMAAAEAGGFSRLSEFLCQANKDDIASTFGGGVGDLSNVGVDPDELFAAMKIDFQDTTVTEVSKSDTEATVHLKGKMALAFDEPAMREIVRQILVAQGLEATDQMIDVAMSTMESQLSQTQEIDADMKVIQENGKWVICEG